MLNNLTSPRASDAFGTVVQEKVPNKKIPPNKIDSNIDLIGRTFLAYFLFSSPFSPDGPRFPLAKLLLGQYFLSNTQSALQFFCHRALDYGMILT
jgi:hypothetical protein